MKHRAQLHKDNNLRDFFVSRSCYDLLAESSKIVVLDIKLSVKRAFFALVENDIQSAPLWDGDEQKIVGMLTGRDYINLLRHLYYNPKGVEGLFHENSNTNNTNTKTTTNTTNTPGGSNPSVDYQSNDSNTNITLSNLGPGQKRNFLKILEQMPIKVWREKIPPLHSELIWVGVESDLYTAARKLVDNNINRLPIIDKEQTSVVYTITRYRILKFVFLNVPVRPAFFRMSIGELGIGTFDNLVTVSLSTPLIQVLNLFQERKISAIPVVDHNGGLVDIYSRTDLPFLSASENLYLDMPVGQVISVSRGISNLPLFSLNDSLESVLDRMISLRQGHLLCTSLVDHSSSHIPKGIISLNDILRLFIS
eukprot:TRINITY_DN12898_c0_g1_i1.p1 TRINITY_DN12898_c0_g1~~TRINITY_DN12898_c0_g1_i1.p1  ORF type:complete len:365 (-),score=75.68 TRINITY_DN12898_c0_g1_i1:76-1170(-)